MKNHKLLIGIVAVLVIVLGAYLYFSGNSQSKKPVTSTLASSNTGTNPVALGNDAVATASSFAGSDIASMLKNISQIRLNTGVLQNPAFLTLIDTTLALPQTTVSGRVNPFGRSGALDSAAPVSASQINGTVTETSTPSTTPVVTTPTTPKKP